MIAVKFRIDGFKEAFAKMAKLSRGFARSVWQKAVRAGCSVLLKAIRPVVYRATGALLKSLAVRIKARRGDGAIVGLVGPRRGAVGKRNPARYAHLVEKGRKAFTQSVTRNGVTFTRNMPAIVARPFISRGVELASSAVRDAMIAKINTELERV